MKHYTVTLIFVLIIALSLAGAAAAKSINPDMNAVFSCNSVPNDFNGKTFENLYIFLKGCDNFRSTIIPEDNTFATLRDITVTDTLYYTDDTYNSNTNSYNDTEALENVTYVNSYLNLAGNSRIAKMHIKCKGTHTCNLGMQSPSVIEDLYIFPVNQWRSNIVLRGYIDPLVDEETDYYKDYKVASYPGFSSIDTFIDKMVSDIIFKEWNYDEFSDYNAKYVYYTLRGDESKAMQSFEKYKNMYNSAKIKKMHIYNTYLNNTGETLIDLAHIQCDIVEISDGFYQDGIYKKNSNTSWKPVLRSTGYTTIGAVFLYAHYLKIDAREASVNQNVVRFMPMNVDALIADTNGEKVTVEIGYAKVGILDSFAGISSDGHLELKFNNNNRYSREPNLLSQVGSLLVHGGEITLSQQRGYDVPSIGKVVLLDGRQDATVKTSDPEKFVAELWNNVSKTGKRFIPAESPLPEETFAFNDFFNYEKEGVKEKISMNKKTYVYYYWGAYDWENFIKDIPQKDESAPQLKVHANKITIGEGFSHADWDYDGFCYGMICYDNPSVVAHIKPF